MKYFARPFVLTRANLKKKSLGILDVTGALDPVVRSLCLGLITGFVGIACALVVAWDVVVRVAFHARQVVKSVDSKVTSSVLGRSTGSKRKMAPGSDDDMVVVGKE